MKKISIMLVAMFAIMFAANAQEGRPQRTEGERPGRPSMEEMQKRQLESMKEALTLTDDQVAKVKVINEEAGKKNRALFENREPGQDRSVMREKMTEIRNEQNKKLKKVLTEEQYTKWTKMQEERMQNRQNRGGNGGTRPERTRGEARSNNF